MADDLPLLLVGDLVAPISLPFWNEKEYFSPSISYSLPFVIDISFCCKLDLLELVFLSYQRIFQWVIVQHLTILYLECDMVCLLHQYKDIYVEFGEELRLHLEQSYLVSLLLIRLFDSKEHNEDYTR